MKKIYTTFFIIFCFTFSKAQYVTIPDTAFVSWLNNNGYSTCMSGNQLDTTCSLIFKETIIDISFSNIDSIEGVEYFKNLKRLYTEGNKIRNIAKLPNSLNELYCSGNKLVYIQTLPDSLKILYCNQNQLSSLPALPLMLNTLDCSSNFINKLPTLPDSLRHLNCNINKLDSLPHLPEYIEDLSCSSNDLSFLPQLPTSIHTLICYRNHLTFLPQLPISLRSLDCSENDLFHLFSIPERLIHLNCSWDKLRTLPKLPDSLIYLACARNSLDSLPILNSTLDTLLCPYDSLYWLPYLPKGLTSLNCASNYLTSLPALPDSMNLLDVTYNLGLICLPRINKIYYLQFTYTSIKCLPDNANIDHSLPSFDTIPLCSKFNPDECPLITNYLTIQLRELGGIKVYPNPASDVINIEIPKSITPVEISILDNMGRVWKKLNTQQTKSQIDIEELPQGIYFIQIKTPDEASIRKLVKE